MQLEAYAERYGKYVKRTYNTQHGAWPKILDEDLYLLREGELSAAARALLGAICRVFGIPNAEYPAWSEAYECCVSLGQLYRRYCTIRMYEQRIGTKVRYRTEARYVEHTVIAVTSDFLLMVTGRDRPQHPLWFI